MMDFEEDEDNADSGNVSSGEEDFGMDVDISSAKDRQQEALEDYPYEVLTTEEIVQHMIDCIKDVNTVVEVIRCYPIANGYQIFGLHAVDQL